MVLKRHQRQELTLRWNRKLLTNVVMMLWQNLAERKQKKKDFILNY